MSTIMSWWLFKGDREFPLPYEKRTNSSNSNTFSKDGWSEWFSGRIDAAISNKHNGLSVVSQLQVMGGNNSMLQKNAKNGTSYSWRDTTIGGTWDAFYSNRENAIAWQYENDSGRSQYFCKDNRRLLWGSYGEWDMKQVWHYYDQASYQKLQQIRNQADPIGIFTPNHFCVEAAE